LLIDRETKNPPRQWQLLLNAKHILWFGLMPLAMAFFFSIMNP
jgi:hypothetical protein